MNYNSPKWWKDKRTDENKLEHLGWNYGRTDKLEIRIELCASNINVKLWTIFLINSVGAQLRLEPQFSCIDEAKKFAIFRKRLFKNNL